MILSDYDILNELAASSRIGIDPFDNEQLQPASYDLTLGEDLKILRTKETGELEYIPVRFGKGQSWALRPGDCALATTAERISLPRDIAGRVEGKSTIGRRFLFVHVSAGFVDPGFQGEITLELHNASPVRQNITPGMRIGQISFLRLTTPAMHPYNGHYQNQKGATPAWNQQ